MSSIERPLLVQVKSNPQSRHSEQTAEFDIDAEVRFEQCCLSLLTQNKWEQLLIFADAHLIKKGSSKQRAYFYRGVANYKLANFDDSLEDFNYALAIIKDRNDIYGLSTFNQTVDPQLYYNLGLVNFKLQQYSKAVEHFKTCIQIDPCHPFAYNNLAFLYNMHQFYSETVNICKAAKEANRHGHNTHRHWAFAEFKRGDCIAAIKKIRKGAMKQPESADNWVVWGHILRTAGKYTSAKHKF